MIGDVFLECTHYQTILKKTFYERDGISDSVNTCLLNYKSGRTNAECGKFLRKFAENILRKKCGNKKLKTRKFF